MKSKNASYSLMLVLILLAFAVFKLRSEPKQKEAFDRTPSELIYTKHALCRMDCRKISKADIDEVMKEGVINLAKSDKKDRPCPTFALQDRTDKGQYIRVIFAECNGITKVVTCYNLEKDFVCNCPDDKPSQPNQN